MRRTLLGLGTALALLPMTAFAAFERPSDIMRSVLQGGHAWDSVYEIHLQVPSENVYASMWTKGTSEPLNGAINTLGNSEMKMTIDIVAPKTNVRAKIQAKIKDNVFYVHLDNVTGTYTDELLRAAAQISGPKWFRFPVDVSEMTVAMDMEQMYTVIDRLFVLEKKGPNYYTMKTHSPDEIVDFMSSMGMHDVAEISSLLTMGSAEARIETSGDDVRIARFSFSVNMNDEPFDGLKLTGKGTSSVHWGAYAVTAPTESVDIEELANDLMPGALPIPTWFPVDDEDSMMDDFEDIDWSDFEDDMMIDSGAGCTSSDPAERLRATRHGECGRPSSSPRRIERRMNSPSDQR